MSPNEPPSWQPPPNRGGAPPPPPPGATVPPPPPPIGPGPGTAAPGYGYGPPPGSPPSYGVPPSTYVTAMKPPRPAIQVAGWLMIVGAAVIVVGCFLPWLTDLGGSVDSINGFDEGPDDAALGGGLVFFALVLVGMGITSVAAKRILAIVIIGIVTAALSLVTGVAQLADYADYTSFAFVDAELGAGLPVVVLGSAAALGGAIAGTARRRRW